MMCTMQAHISEVFERSGDTITPVEVLTVLKCRYNCRRSSFSANLLVNQTRVDSIDQSDMFCFPTHSDCKSLSFWTPRGRSWVPPVHPRSYARVLLSWVKVRFLHFQNQTKLKWPQYHVIWAWLLYRLLCLCLCSLNSSVNINTDKWISVWTSFCDRFDREAQETTFIHQVFGGHLRSRG